MIRLFGVCIYFLKNTWGPTLKIWLVQKKFQLIFRLTAKGLCECVWYWRTCLTQKEKVSCKFEISRDFRNPEKSKYPLLFPNIFVSLGGSYFNKWTRGPKSHREAGLKIWPVQKEDFYEPIDCVKFQIQTQKDIQGCRTLFWK